MTSPTSPTSPPTAAPPAKPSLTLHLVNFAAQDPGSWQPMLDRAVAADRAGIDRITVSDHVVMGERLEEYGKPEVGGMKGSKQPTGPDGLWLDPLTVLSVVAGQTSNVRLGTNILVVPLRRPIVLAKAAATLDVLSGGRLDLGVGVGWQREEYEAAGLPFEGRGELLDDALAVLQNVWTNSPAKHESKFLTFDKIHVMPQPLQPGGVPLLISGTINARTLRRMARFGSGWIPWGDDIADPSAGLGRIAEAMAEAGRSMDGFRVFGNLSVRADENGALQLDRALEPIPAQIAAGITDFGLTLPLPAGVNDAAEVLGNVAAAFRARVAAG